MIVRLDKLVHEFIFRLSKILACKYDKIVTYWCKKSDRVLTYQIQDTSIKSMQNDDLLTFRKMLESERDEMKQGMLIQISLKYIDANRIK